MHRKHPDVARQGRPRPRPIPNHAGPRPVGIVGDMTMIMKIWMMNLVMMKSGIMLIAITICFMISMI